MGCTLGNEMNPISSVRLAEEDANGSVRGQAGGLGGQLKP